MDVFDEIIEDHNEELNEKYDWLSKPSFKNEKRTVTFIDLYEYTKNVKKNDDKIEERDEVEINYGKLNKLSS